MVIPNLQTRKRPGTGQQAAHARLVIYAPFTHSIPDGSIWEVKVGAGLKYKERL